MANKYVRSTDGSGADDGSTWALAKASLSAHGGAAGDTVFVSQAHAETAAAALTINLQGTQASPSRIICANDAAEPPTAEAETATVSTTGSSSIVTTGNGYIYGVALQPGSGANYAFLRLNNQAANGFQEFEKCKFRLNDTHSLSAVWIGTEDGGYSRTTRIKNSSFKLTNAGHCINIYGDVFLNGFNAESGITTPSAGLFKIGTTSKHGILLCENSDFSNFSSSLRLVMQGGDSKHGRAIFRNNKMPAGWTLDNLVYSGLGAWTGIRVEAWNTDAGDTNYKLGIVDNAGTIRDETTIVRTGGASDGTTTYSWKMVSNTYANALGNPLYSPDIAEWNETTGSAVTFTIDIVHDSATALTDNEVWLEVEYLGTSGVPLGINVSDRRATPLATAANQASSSETWTTTGLTTPNKQKLSVTFTPQEKGWMIGRVYLGKASKTIYVDPKRQAA